MVECYHCAFDAVVECHVAELVAYALFACAIAVGPSIGSQICFQLSLLKFGVCLFELIVIYLNLKYWYSIVYQYVQRGLRTV